MSYQDEAPNFVPGVGNPDAQLAIVGDFPGYYDNNDSQPFTGKAGQILDDLLEEAEIDRNDLYLTNVLKYMPPNFDLRKCPGLDIDSAVNALNRELANFPRLNCILALGDLTLKVLTGKVGLTKWRGSILQSIDGKYKVVSTIHPFKLTPGPKSMAYQARAYMLLDILRAKDESRTNVYVPQTHNLIIGRTVLEVYRFLQLCRRKGRVAGDIEASRSIPICIAFAYDRHNAMSIPLLDIQSSTNPDGIAAHEQLEIIKLVAEFLEDPKIEFIWQNGKYDKERLENTFCIVCPRSHFDTSLAAHTLNPEFPKSLAFLSSIYTKVPFHKDEGKDIDIIKATKGKKVKWDKKKVYLYNAKDTVVDYEIYENQVKELEETGLTTFFNTYVMRQDDFYRRMESRGFLIDERLRLEKLESYLLKEKKIKEELKELVGHPVNWNSPDQVKKLLYEELNFPVGQDAKEETLVMLLANHTINDKDDRRARILRGISVGRRTSKTIGTYFLAPPDYDGRMRTVYRLAVTEEGRNGGTETGRTSTSVLKSPVRPEKMGWALQTVTKHGDIGQDALDILIADPGYVLISVDASQAEARACANYSSDQETLDRFDKEDIHRRTASWCLDIPYEKINKKDPERQIGKTVRYLRQYRGEKRRLMHTIMSDAFRYNLDINVSEWKCGKIIEKFDAYTPKIRDVFWHGVETQLDIDRTLITPHGRRRTFFGKWDDNLFREAYPYLCSAMVRDHLTGAMFRIEDQKPDTLFMMEWHDAFTVMVKEQDLKEYCHLIKQEMEVAINFDKCSLKRPDLVIPCEVKYGHSMGEMEEFKF
jgi:uracil-DNA glycosylase family 4